MIQPDKLRQYSVAEIPFSVFYAWEAHRAFVTASSHAAESIGVRFLEGVKPDTIVLGFFRQMLEHRGTYDDVQWLLDKGVINLKDDVPLWHIAVKEYASRALS